MATARTDHGLPCVYNDTDPVLQSGEGAAIPLASSAGRTIAVSVTGSTTPTTAYTPASGQKTVSVTNTAVQLGAGTTVLNQLIVSAHLVNTANVYLGSSTVTSATGLILEPGRGVTIAGATLATVYINGTSGDGVSFFALS